VDWAEPIGHHLTIPNNYVAIAIYGLRRLAYSKTRDLNMKWMILDVAIG
jgi:hypothetical protein